MNDIIDKLFNGSHGSTPNGIGSLTAVLEAMPDDAFGKVPRELRGRRQWVLWKLDPGKIPCQVDGSKAKTNDPSTWTTFDAAVSAWRADPGKFAGIGYVFADDDPYTGIDFDNCLVDGEVAQWAAPWLGKLNGCYAEISPSGNGIKVWVRGKFEGAGGKRTTEGQAHTGIEIYCRTRFFCVTGDVYDAPVGEIPDRQDATDELYAWVKTRPTKAAPAAAPKQPSFKTTATGPLDKLARARMCVMSDKHPDAVEGCGGHDVLYSVMCALVDGFGLGFDEAYPIGSDFNQAKAIPPESDYQVRHKLNDAIAAHPTPSLRLLNAGRQPGASPTSGKPAEAAEIDVRLAKRPRTDLGNGERLAARFGDQIRYCKPWGKWLVWDGKRFAIDDTGAIDRLAKKTVRKMFAEAATLEDDDKRKQLAHHALASESRASLSAMMGLASTEAGIPVGVSDMNRDPWLLNCANGTIDLKTGALRRHDQADLITQLCPVKFDPNAKCPLWDATLNLFFAGDQKLIAYWQRVVGYCLVGVIRDHVMPIAYGAGSNGKSTILGAMMDMLGTEYAMKAHSGMLMAKVHDAHPTDKADLFGKRLVIAIETENGRRLDEVMVKELTGGDKVRARRMREDFWEFPPTHTLVMATNHKPVIRGTDHGIWRRLKLIPFTVTMDDAKADTSVPEKLAAEFPGILAWAVRGCLAWQEIGLAEPDTVKESTAAYRGEQDVIGAFLAERTLRDAVAPDTRCGVIYAAYKEWAEKSGEGEISMRAFGESMKERGYETKASNGKWYVGLGLRSY